MKITAAGLFLIALAINVKVTLDDPFTMVNEKATAETTTVVRRRAVDTACQYETYCDGFWIKGPKGIIRDCPLDPTSRVSCLPFVCNATYYQCDNE